MRAKVDLTGNVFGELTATNSSYRKNNRTYWRCICSCGKEITVAFSNLRSGHTKSCGCLSQKREDFTGQKFNILTLLEFDSIKNGEAHWLCRCDCGTEKVLSSVKVKSGWTKSCGCISKRIGPNSHMWAGFGDISSSFWRRVISGAKRRNILFKINIKEAWDRFKEQNNMSQLSGIDLEFSKNYIGLPTASLDRIDSDEGYTKDNIQWVHKDENIIKGLLSVKELLYWCKLITNKDNSEYSLIIDNIKHRSNWRGLGLLSRSYFCCVSCRARYGNLEFNTTIQYMWDLFLKQHGRCAITNLPIFFKNKITPEQTAGLDRIDSSKGYVEGNIQWVHKTINKMKWDFEQEYFISLCSKIYNYNLGQPRT